MMKNGFDLETKKGSTPTDTEEGSTFGEYFDFTFLLRVMKKPRTKEKECSEPSSSEMS